MRVVHLITSLAADGAQVMLYKLLLGMDRATFTPLVVSLTDAGVLGESIQKLGVPVRTLGLRAGLPTPLALWRLRREVRQFEPDLVQGWMYHGNVAALLARVFLTEKVPVLWNIRHSLHNITLEKRSTAALIRLGARLSQKPTHIIYNAHVSAIQHEQWGYRPEKRAVIPNGFDTQRFIPSSHARLQIRAELALPASTFLIGLIGRYHPLKDHANFLRAGASLRQVFPEVHLLCAGRNVDGENTALMGLVQRLGLCTHAHLLGERRDIPSLMAALDVLTVSSSAEAFPNVIGEAMACGVPCVVTDVGDSASIVGETGRVVPPNNPKSIAEAWRELIEIGPDERQRLGAAARQRIQEQYSLPAIATRYAGLYTGSVSQPL